MAATEFQNLEGLFKDVYGDKLEELIPASGKLTRMIPFREAEKLGKAFVQTVVLQDEQGATYAASDEDYFTLNEPEAMATKPASVDGSQLMMRGILGQKAAVAAKANDKKAFASATATIVKRLLESAVKRIEIQHLYGGSGLGVGDTSVNVSATETVVTMTAASFAPGIWIGSKGAKLEAFDGATQIGTGSFTVKAVDCANKELTVTALAGDITALDAQLVAGNVDLFYAGAKDKEALGLDRIITTSGSLFGIDNTVYDLFKGQTYDASGAALTFDKITDAVVCAVNYGLDEDVVCLVSPLTWQSLNKDEAALRQYDVSYKSSELTKGTEALKYHGQNGSIEIMAHSMVKEGEAFIIPPRRLKRVGAQDISMRNPVADGKMVFIDPNRAGFEFRVYSDQALFTDHPAHLVKIINIVN